MKGGLAFDDGTVFAGNYAGEIYAIDASNGQVKWTAHTQGGGLLRGGGVYSTPAVAWGRVYLGGLDGRIYSFVEKTGELAWSHSTGAEVYPSPAVADTPHSPPTVYAGSQDKHFYALDARTGELRWEHPVDGVVLGSSSVVGETVYVSMIGPNIGTFGYNVKSGKKVFDNDQGEYNPVISDGKKIYLTGASTIRAFKPEPRQAGTASIAGAARTEAASRAERVSDRDPGLAEVLLGLPHGVLAVVEDRGAEHRVGAALDDALRQVAELPGPAGGDHRHRDRVGHRAGQLEVVAVRRPVAIHARQQHLPGPALGRLPSPGDRLATLDHGATAIDVDVPAAVPRASHRSQPPRIGNRTPRPARRSARVAPGRRS